MLTAISTFAGAIAIGGAACIRLNWPTVVPKLRVPLTIACGACVLIYALELMSGWHTTSVAFNEIQRSLTLGCYALLVLLISTARPRWLTITFASVLFLVAPVTWLLFAISALFVGEEAHAEPIGKGFYALKSSWNAGAMGSSGVDLHIAYRPNYLPFLERRITWVRFDNAKCDSGRAFLVMQPDGKHVLARCPWHERDHKDGYHDVLVPLN